ncbi:FUSC family protein [Tepidibacter hydrothermalis]|uniref:FUSC family protein n=1 Tax=Tepidibacter hydrothermalis TaxID=3036126 RepID=A0ABY8EEA8_9FIRM|nr:FUSC family protein [Tepidibacter hydrothermalis]WFD11289.1 FUSC family protein [Tepidibacter hydrothermalis]
MQFINNKLNLQFDKLDFKFGFRYTFIFLLSLTFNGYLFGLNFGLLSAIISFLYFTIPNRNIKIRPLSKIAYIYLNIISITFLGYLATTNLFLSLLFNLLVPFVVVCVLTNETNINGYMFYYFLFIFMQILNINLDILNFYLLSIFIALIIGYVFEEVIFSKNHKNIDVDIIDFKEYFFISLKSNYTKLRNGLNLDSFISRFAFRLSIATVFSFVFFKYLNLPKWYWISISSCCTLVPICSENNARAFNRIKGTVIGAFIFLISSFLIKDTFTFMILASFSILLTFAYLPHNRQTESFVFSTYVTLSCSIISLSSITATIYRVLYVFIGAFIAILFNKLVLPNKKIYLDNDKFSF